MEPTQQNMDGNNKNMTTTVVIVILIIVAGIIFFAMRKDTDGNKNDDQSADTSSMTETDQTKGGSPVGATGTGATVGAVRQAYADALVTYKNSRIQFGETCNATPLASTYKSGTTILIDNRSKTARTFSLNNTKYSIGSYDYALVPLSYDASLLPRTVSIDCGSHFNAATVTIQR